MRELAYLLPALYRTTGEDAALQSAMEQMAAGAEADTTLTMEQLIPSTVSVDWGLRLWERAWGIPIDTTKTVEQRRERVLGKIKGTGTSTVALLCAVAQSYASQASIREEPEQSHFVVALSGIPEALDSLTGQIDEVKPAHLSWHYAFHDAAPETIHVGATCHGGGYWLLGDLVCSADPASTATILDEEAIL